VQDKNNEDINKQTCTDKQGKHAQKSKRWEIITQTTLKHFNN